MTGCWEWMWTAGSRFPAWSGAHHTSHDLGHGLAVARIGFIPGDTDEISLGLSAAWGRSIMAHEGVNDPDMADMDTDQALHRALGGVDATLYLGRWLTRIEVSSGRVDHRSVTTGFAALDFPCCQGWILIWR